jgi:hypothetical protein
LLLVPKRIAAAKMTTIKGTTKNGEVMSIGAVSFGIQSSRSLVDVWGCCAGFV